MKVNQNMVAHQEKKKEEVFTYVVISKKPFGRNVYVEKKPWQGKKRKKRKKVLCFIMA